jgi:hypothetical protein
VPNFDESANSDSVILKFSGQEEESKFYEFSGIRGNKIGDDGCSCCCFFNSLLSSSPCKPNRPIIHFVTTGHTGIPRVRGGRLDRPDLMRNFPKICVSSRATLIVVVVAAVAAVSLLLF